MKAVEVIEPGLVILRNFVDDEECEMIAASTIIMGDSEAGESGFYTKTAGGETILNTGEARGRIYDAASRFPPDLIETCNRAVSAARALDTAMPEMLCTHVLLNMYTTSAGLLWHRDIYENDGKSDHPVVNLCVGASCKFGFKHKDEDPERVTILQSGDILLFGGPCRLIKHAVLEVMLDDCPAWMTAEPCRFSFTFRDSPEVIGREEEFKYFRISENLVGQDNFEIPEDIKEFKGISSAPLSQSGNTSLVTNSDLDDEAFAPFPPSGETSLASSSDLEDEEQKEE